MKPRIEWDPDLGQLEIWDEGYIREVINIRQGIVEEATRRAVIVELESLGYTVLGPYL